MSRVVVAVFVCLSVLAPRPSHPCNAVLPLATPQQLCDRADVIVRAVALRYEVQPTYREDGSWDWGRIEFEVCEVIKGESPQKLVVEGELTTQDDYNLERAPYPVVRGDGRRGSCYARRYRGGAQFLLLLQYEYLDGELTPYWSPLSPTNEQLIPPRVWRGGDPWLAWVRVYLAQSRQ